MLHLPQFWWSVWTSLHTPLQQKSVTAQMLGQLPQCSVSASRFTHVLLQHVVSFRLAKNGVRQRPGTLLQ